jgi:arginase
MRRAGGSLWRARAGLGSALQSQQQQHARSYARSVVLTEEEGQQRVVEASLTLVRELARLKADHVRKRGGAIATSCMLGVPLGHNSSFLQVPLHSTIARVWWNFRNFGCSAL